MNSLNSDLIIAVDGYSSCGKSTLAKSLANHLNYIYIDSGAMYRVVTLFSLQNNLIFNGSVLEQSLLGRMKDIDISFKYNYEKKRNEVYLNHVNVEEEIRGMRVSDNVSNVSKICGVRKLMVDLQQKMGQKKRIIMDGRDIGTVVFPHADLKFFMTANPDIRAERRYKEYLETGQIVSMEEVKENIAKRDYIDVNRDESPLRKADDAIVLDNSNLSKEEQLQWILNYIKDKFPSVLQNKGAGK